MNSLKLNLSRLTHTHTRIKYNNNKNKMVQKKNLALSHISTAILLFFVYFSYTIGLYYKIFVYIKQTQKKHTNKNGMDCNVLNLRATKFIHYLFLMTIFCVCWIALPCENSFVCSSIRTRSSYNLIACQSLSL